MNKKNISLPSDPSLIKFMQILWPTSAERFYIAQIMLNP